MGGVLVFRKGVRAHRVLFRRESWVSGALLVFDDDVRFFTPDPRDRGIGIIDYFQWPEVISIKARNGLVRGAVDIVLQRGQQRFLCLDAVGLAERLKRVHAAALASRDGTLAQTMRRQAG